MDVYNGYIYSQIHHTKALEVLSDENACAESHITHSHYPMNCLAFSPGSFSAFLGIVTLFHHLGKKDGVHHFIVLLLFDYMYLPCIGSCQTRVVMSCDCSPCDCSPYLVQGLF